MGEGWAKEETELEVTRSMEGLVHSGCVEVILCIIGVNLDTVVTLYLRHIKKENMH